MQKQIRLALQTALEGTRAPPAFSRSAGRNLRKRCTRLLLSFLLLLTAVDSQRRHRAESLLAQLAVGAAGASAGLQTESRPLRTAAPSRSATFFRHAAPRSSARDARVLNPTHPPTHPPTPAPPPAPARPGAAFFPLEPHLGPRSLAQLLAQATPVARLTSATHRGRLPEDGTPTLDFDRPGWRAAAAAAAAAAPPPSSWPRAAPYDAGIVTMTSGTTGAPKTVRTR